MQRREKYFRFGAPQLNGRPAGLERAVEFDVVQVMVNGNGGFGAFRGRDDGEVNSTTNIPGNE